MSSDRLFSMVLAAGRSSRYGSPKQLARYHGQSLAKNATQLAYSVSGSDTVLVVGAAWQSVVESCSPFAGTVAHNQNFEQGMASSIACGLRAIDSDADAVLILLADQPLITPEHLHALATQWRKSDSSIVASEFAAVAGPPVIFPVGFFSSLRNLTGDQGGRTIINQNVAEVIRVPFHDARIDIDTPDDLQRLF